MHILRKEDKEEIKANANIKAIDALIQGFQLSEVPISVFDDKEEIVCMLGCCPTMISLYAWLRLPNQLLNKMLSTARWPMIRKAGLNFLARCR